MNLIQTLRSRFSQPITDLLSGVDGAPSIESILDMIRPAQDPKFGDYQANCAMPLKRWLDKPPREIAAAIVAYRRIPKGPLRVLALSGIIIIGIFATRYFSDPAIADIEAVKAAARQAVEDDTPYFTDFRIARPDGALRPAALGYRTHLYSCAPPFPPLRSPLLKAP